jgi:centrosomal protein CEP135
LRRYSKEVDDVVAAYQELGAENRRLAAAAAGLERDGQRARLALDAGQTALAQAGQHS